MELSYSQFAWCINLVSLLTPLVKFDLVPLANKQNADTAFTMDHLDLAESELPINNITSVEVGNNKDWKIKSDVLYLKTEHCHIN